MRRDFSRWREKDSLPVGFDRKETLACLGSVKHQTDGLINWRLIRELRLQKLKEDVNCIDCLNEKESPERRGSCQTESSGTIQHAGGQRWLDEASSSSSIGNPHRQQSRRFHWETGNSGWSPALCQQRDQAEPPAQFRIRRLRLPAHGSAWSASWSPGRRFEQPVEI